MMTDVLGNDSEYFSVLHLKRMLIPHCTYVHNLLFVRCWRQRTVDGYHVGGVLVKSVLHKALIILLPFCG